MSVSLSQCVAVCTLASLPVCMVCLCLFASVKFCLIISMCGCACPCLSACGAVYTLARLSVCMVCWCQPVSEHGCPIITMSDCICPCLSACAGSGAPRCQGRRIKGARDCVAVYKLASLSVCMVCLCQSVSENVCLIISMSDCICPCLSACAGFLVPRCQGMRIKGARKRARRF